MEVKEQKLYTTKFWLLCGSSFFFFSSFNLIIPELPDYLTSLGGGEHKGLIIPVFTLMAAISRPFSGKLTDSIGRVPIMIYGVIVCIVCGVMYTVMTSVIAFFLLRLLHGMSTGFKPTATSAYVGDLSPLERRGEAMGVLGMFGSLGMASAPYFGSMIAQYWGYNALFYTSSAYALISILVVIRMPETLKPTVKFSPSLLKVKLSDAFEPSAIPPAIGMLLTTFSFGTILTLIPDLSKHIGIGNKGLFYLIFTLTSIAVRFSAGKVSDKYGRAPMLIIGSLIYCVTMFMLGFSQSKLIFYITGVLYGLGMGINSPTIFAWTIDLADDRYRGRAMATTFIAMEIGIGMGGLVSGYSYGNNPANFGIAFSISGFLCLLAVIYLIFWQRKHSGEV